MTAPLLVLGPSLGTTSETLWGECARLLEADHEVLHWDLPGHGTDRSVPRDPLRMRDLADQVLDRVSRRTTGAFHYAGDSVGGAVGLQLLLDAPKRVLSATLLCTGARIGTPESWAERIAQVRTAGTSSLLETSASRWFGTGFLERRPERGSALLHALADTDDLGYAAVCGALAAFDVRDRLGEVAAPVLAVAGSEDVATPPTALREIADSVQHGRAVVLDGVGHLAPAEDPDGVAELIRSHVATHHRGEA